MSDSNWNADPAELGKFDELARSWWDKTGEFKALHDINGLRMAYIHERTTLAGMRVLDVGCGGGILSEALACQSARVLGIDLADGPLQVARLHALEGGLEIDYRKTSIESLAAKGDEQFDVITCLEVLEHIPEPESVIEAATQLLKPGGHLFLSTINRNLKAFLLAIVGGEYVTRMVPRGTHDYSKLIKPSELARALRASGFEIGDISGLTYNPLTRRYKLGKDVDVNYFIYARPTSR